MFILVTLQTKKFGIKRACLSPQTNKSTLIDQKREKKAKKEDTRQAH